MATNSQFTPHEAAPIGRFTSENAAEMGARGAAKREQNMRERATETRHELTVHAEEAARTLGAILMSDARDADKVRAAVAILDRIGVGPHSTQEQLVGVSIVEQGAAELDEAEAGGGFTPEGDTATHEPRVSLPPAREAEIVWDSCDTDPE